MCLSLLAIAGCSDANSAAYQETVKGANNNDDLVGEVYLPILNYNVTESRHTYYQPVVSVLHNGDLIVLELGDGKVNYSDSLESFESAYLRAKVDKNNTFTNMSIISKEEFLKAKGGN